MMKKLPDAHLIFRKSLQYIINILTVFVIVVLVIGLYRTIHGITVLASDQPISTSFNLIVTDILTFLVIIELFRSFINYFEAHRFRLHTMIDPAIVFVMRELIVMLYKHEQMEWMMLFAFGFVILCLGIVRAMAVYFTPGCEETKK